MQELEWMMIGMCLANPELVEDIEPSDFDDDKIRGYFNDLFFALEERRKPHTLVSLVRDQATGHMDPDNYPDEPLSKTLPAICRSVSRSKRTARRMQTLQGMMEYAQGRTDDIASIKRALDSLEHHVNQEEKILNAEVTNAKAKRKTEESPKP